MAFHEDILDRRAAGDFSDLLVVFYDRLVKEPEAQLARMLRFLGRPASDHAIWCAPSRVQGSGFRV